jgi:hypothetical protein
MLIEHHSIHLN